MAFARVRLLPPQHPAKRLFFIADGWPEQSWVSFLRNSMVDPKLPSIIPDILSCGMFSSDEFASAESDPVERKLLLRRYPTKVVRPTLLAYDHACYVQAVQHVVELFGVPLISFQPKLSRPPARLLEAPHAAHSWKWHRIWSLVRLSGRWPLVVQGGDEMPVLLSSCALCLESNVDILHPLCDCTYTLPDFVVWSGTVLFGHRRRVVDFYDALFYDGNEAEDLLASIKYVGSCVSRCAWGDDGEDPSEDVDAALHQGDVEVLLQLAQARANVDADGVHYESDETDV